MVLLVPRVTYALDREGDPQRLLPTNVNSKHFNRPVCWGKWAKEFPPVGHNHLDPPEKPKSKYNKTTPEQRRAITSKGGKASTSAGIRKGFGGHKHLQDLCDAKAFEEGTVADVDGETVINLPADTGKKIVEVLVDGYPTQSYPDRVSAMNYYTGYSRRANTLVFNQAIPKDSIITVIYWRDFARPALTTDTNDILDKMHLLPLYGALAEAGMYFQHDRTGEWSGTFDRLLLEAVGEYQDRELSGYGGPMVVQAPMGAGADY